MICCPLTGSDGEDGPKFCNRTTPKARKEYKCSECYETIPTGAKYEKYVGVWDGGFDTYRTCLSCVEIRDHFACDGWIFGQLWSDLEENFFPDMKAGGPCMEGLSVDARHRLFAERERWLFDNGEERDGAPPPLTT